MKEMAEKGVTVVEREIATGVRVGIPMTKTVVVSKTVVLAASLSVVLAPPKCRVPNRVLPLLIFVVPGPRAVSVPRAMCVKIAVVTGATLGRRVPNIRLCLWRFGCCPSRRLWALSSGAFRRRIAHFLCAISLGSFSTIQPRV